MYITKYAIHTSPRHAWSEGGSYISIQVDNETPNVSYLEALKAMGVAAGMKPCFWVKTGWPSPSTPVAYGSLVPLFGGYTDDFWSDINEISTGYNIPFHFPGWLLLLI